MNFITDKLAKYGWNERELNEEDFHLICEKEGIVVFEFEMRRNGMYGVCEDVPVILLNKKLRGIRKLEVAFHEVGHHFFHSPSLCLFSRNMTRRHQLEAQAVAVVALIPYHRIETLLRSDEISEYPAKLIKFRLEVLEYYGI